MKPVIQTFTGRMVNPCRLQLEDIDIRDIAHALALKVRYTGQSPVRLSIAQHSVLVSERCSDQNKLWGLMHDAAEAYLPDVSRPVKVEMRALGFTFFDDLEAQVMQTICRRFGIPLLQPDEVTRVDDNMLATEALCLFGMYKTFEQWHHRKENGYTIYREADLPWGPCGTSWSDQIAEHMFLKTFRTLYFGE